MKGPDAYLKFDREKPPFMTPLRSALCAFILLFLASSGSAQYFNSLRSNAWKRHRSEFTLRAGASSFLGELGGRDQVGSDFLWDLETAETQPCGGVGFRYYIGKHHALNVGGSIGWVSGDDALTDEKFRSNRNLHFRSIIVEAALKYELHFSFKKLGNLYGIGKRSARAKNKYRDLYLFAGVGGFYFNPKAYYEGEWVELQPLGTEGQGFEGEPDRYDLYQPSIPMGLGMRFGLGRKYRIGLEVGYRKTFTDYIDDVSTDYYDNDKLRRRRGNMAADLADPSKGEIPTYTSGTYTYDPTAEGMQRGDPSDKDAYIFTTITFSWKIGMKTYGGMNWQRKTRAKF
jgi:hypothetical protein